ncbi:MAG: hypothetical protein ACTJFV_00830 [Moraxellaceae bacterium]
MIGRIECLQISTADSCWFVKAVFRTKVPVDDSFSTLARLAGQLRCFFIEQRLVGYAFELSGIDFNIYQIRHDAEQYGSALTTAAKEVLLS